MNFKILSFLISWMLPHRKDRQTFRHLCDTMESRKTTPKVQSQYKKIQQTRTKKEKYNVIFLINEVAKWKCQSLYDAMIKSNKYEPCIVLTIADIQRKLNLNDKKNIIEKNTEYFKRKGMKVLVKYDLISDKAMPLKDLNPDVVFYQQPYSLSKNQAPTEVSKYALTAYVPYYVPVYRNLELDCGLDFHHKVFRFYVLDYELEQEYKKHLKEINEYSDNIKAVGHTVLDLFNEKSKTINKDYVIYAPHWSINSAGNENTINISTFDKNGMDILNFAKRHPEVNWVFKPHPTLKTALRRIGWNNTDILNYYDEWKKIALVSFDSNYIDLFMNSKAMITDSGSFLLEYFVTGKPLIHLISDSATSMPYKELRQYFRTFYEAHSCEELHKILDEIIINNQDPKANERKELLEKADFLKTNAAKNIIEDLDNIFQGKIE